MLNLHVHATQRHPAARVGLAALVAMIGILLLVFLTSCGQQTPLSNVAASAPVITPNGDGKDDSLTIDYLIGQRSRVSIYLQDAAGKRYGLRDNVLRMPAAQHYSLRFDGTVSDEPPVVQHVLPDGQYTYVVEATPEGGGTPARQTGTITVRDAATRLPLVDGLKVFPETVTPNEDARDDVTTFSYRLPITATVTINISDGKTTIPFISDVEEGPYEQSHIWDGKAPGGALLPSGVYTYTVRAADRIGNVVQRTGTLRIESPGRAEAHVTYADIAPVEVALGNVITVTVKVKNTGDVPIRTQGPASGYRYDTNEKFSSVEEQRWAEKGGGFWRVGLDWGGGQGYPFRWAMTPRPPDQWREPGLWDELRPGEEATITGTVEILQRDDRMFFYVGLVHEGVGYPEHRKAVTLVKVGF